MEDAVLRITRLEEINKKPVSEYTVEDRKILFEGAQGYYKTIVEKHQQKLHGLAPEQVIYLAQFYQSMTNKDPRKISFGVNTSRNIEMILRDGPKARGTNELWGSW